jgi:hypothetical protein
MKKHSDKGSDAGELDAFSSATEMLQALRQRHISAVELLDLHFSWGKSSVVSVPRRVMSRGIPFVVEVGQVE